MAKAADAGLAKLKQDLKNKTLAPLYLIYGEEDFLKEYYFNAIKNAVLNGVMDDFNLISFEGAKQNTEEISIALDTPPMMADKKLVTVKYSNIFKSAAEDIKSFWLSAIEGIDEQTCIVFYEESIDKRGVLYNTLYKC